MSFPSWYLGNLGMFLSKVLESLEELAGQYVMVWNSNNPHYSIPRMTSETAGDGAYKNY